MDKHPLDILNHAVRHGYTDLADKASVPALPYRDEELCQKLTHPGLLLRWVRIYFLPSTLRYFAHPKSYLSKFTYRRHWKQLIHIVDNALTTAQGHDDANPDECLRIQYTRAQYLKAAMDNVRHAAVLPVINPNIKCALLTTRVYKHGGHVAVSTDCGCTKISALNKSIHLQVKQIPKFSTIK